jgi:hypothetical protein
VDPTLLILILMWLPCSLSDRFKFGNITEQVAEVNAAEAYVARLFHVEKLMVENLRVRSEPLSSQPEHVINDHVACPEQARRPELGLVLDKARRPDWGCDVPAPVWRVGVLGFLDGDDLRAVTSASRTLNSIVCSFLPEFAG